MKRAELAARMGGRILESVLSYKDVSNLVYEGLDFHMDCIQIFPNMLEKAQEVRAGRDLPLCAVISYPHGTFTAECPLRNVGHGAKGDGKLSAGSGSAYPQVHH